MKGQFEETAVVKVWVGISVTVLVVMATLALTSAAESAPDESDSYGLVDPASGLWHLYEGDQPAVPFYFGNPGDFPFMGDWDCDGVDTPGLYRQSDGYVYLRNANTQGNANVSFFFGNPGDIPVAGDFNVDGCDTVSIYRPSNQTFYIINELGTNDGGLGAADYFFVFGNPGDKPFIGDFNGNGQDTIGLHRESTGLVYYRNTNSTGNADNQFIFGDPGDRLIAGDWNSNRIDSPGLFRPSNTTVYLRYENSQGNADESHRTGKSGWLPVAGRFGQLTFPPPTTTTTTTTQPPPTKDISWSCDWDSFLSKYECSGNVDKSSSTPETWTCSWAPAYGSGDDWICSGLLYDSSIYTTFWFENRTQIFPNDPAVFYSQGAVDENRPTSLLPWDCSQATPSSSIDCVGDIDPLDRVDEEWMCEWNPATSTKSCSGQIDKSTIAVEQWMCVWFPSFERWNCVGDSLREVMITPIGRPPGL